jgi:hypothetical protein
MLFDIKFWKATAERAVKTFVQTALAAFGTDQLGLLDMPWGQALSLAASAAVLSLLTSLASANFGGSTGPSLSGESTEVKIITVEIEVPAVKKAPVKKAPVVKKPTATKK